MGIKQKIYGTIIACVGCSVATAGHLATKFTSPRLLPVVSIQGGYASINAGDRTQHIIATDSDVFTYTKSGSVKQAGFIGFFLGAEHPLPWMVYPGFFMQLGVEYNDFGSINVQGINTVGIEPQTSTKYHYSYNVKIQQILGTFKLFGTSHERFHPYGEVGLGAAFNHAGQYNVTTTETGSLNLTPEFSKQNKTPFSYSLGLGVDTQVHTKILVGLGYRYSNFGSTSLGNGTIRLNEYQSPTSFTLASSSTDTNQLIARISYKA